jgi:hypothetical protein
MDREISGTDGTFTVAFIAGQFSENLQGRSVISVTVRLYHDPHVLIARHQEAKQAFHGKLAELTAQHLGNIGLADSK